MGLGIGLFEIGMAGLAVLVVGWLIISFSQPSPKRVVIEWISATAMYVALICLFLNLSLNAWEKSSIVAMLAFGFLSVIFISGGLVSLYNVFTCRRGDKAQASAVT